MTRRSGTTGGNGPKRAGEPSPPAQSALPAVAGILRDLPRDASGHALIELPVNERGVPKANITFCGYWRAR